MGTIHRRQFLCVLGGAAGAGALAWHLGAGRFAAQSEQASSSGSLASASRTSWALGAEATITALAPLRQQAERGVEAAFAELELVEEVMSIYRPHSQLSRLNRAGVLDDPHPYLVEVLQAAQDMSRRTDGAFDVTVQPLWALYDQARRTGRLLEEAEIAAARSRVDYSRLEITPRRIRLTGENTAVTLNGIAQGFATDRALAALRVAGVEHALLNTGELGALGHKTPGQPWTVGIQHPRREDAYLGLARLEGRCLSTSGDYATRFDDDGLSHHIFDPRTGRSPAELASVSVVAPTALLADALSTALFVLGPEEGEKLIRRIDGADALVVLKDGRTFQTPGFPAIA